MTEKLVEALRYYADDENWKLSGGCVRNVLRMIVNGTEPGSTVAKRALASHSPPELRYARRDHTNTLQQATKGEQGAFPYVVINGEVVAVTETTVLASDYEQAMGEELERVSHLPHDSHQVCLRFVGQVSNRASAIALERGGVKG